MSEKLIEDTQEELFQEFEDSKVYNLNHQQFKKYKYALIEDVRLDQIGIDAEILMLMEKYKILPDMYVCDGKAYFVRKEMLSIVNRFVHNEMERYNFFISHRNKIKAIVDKINAGTEVTPDVLERVAAGESLEDVIASKIQGSEAILNEEVQNVR